MWQSRIRVKVVVCSATFNNISVISWRSVLLVEETRVPGEITILLVWRISYWKRPKEKVNLKTSNHETAFLRFVSEINSDLIVKRKVFLMSTLLERFRTFLPKECADKYTTYTFQNRLLNHYSDSIVIQSQQGQGKSNIVFSSSIYIGDSIKATGARCVRKKKKKKYYIILQGGELTCVHFFKSSC